MRSLCASTAAMTSFEVSLLGLAMALIPIFEPLTEYLKSLSPSALDLELRILQITDEDLENNDHTEEIHSIDLILDYFTHELSCSNNFEFIQAMIRLFFMRTMVIPNGAPPRGSAAAAASLRRRRAAGGSGSAGAAGNTMLQFYTDDAPGLKISPNVVLIMSIGFIAFVAILHVVGKFYFVPRDLRRAQQ
ncbi:transport protein Sec61 subunit beta [Nymphaea thermarum]|nr:transport protein Sec61 subunit beta [Nymphaea thermarum]